MFAWSGVCHTASRRILLSLWVHLSIHLRSQCLPEESASATSPAPCPPPQPSNDCQRRQQHEKVAYCRTLCLAKKIIPTPTAKATMTIRTIIQAGNPPPSSSSGIEVDVSIAVEVGEAVAVGSAVTVGEAVAAGSAAGVAVGEGVGVLAGSCVGVTVGIGVAASRWPTRISEAPSTRSSLRLASFRMPEKV